MCIRDSLLKVVDCVRVLIPDLVLHVLDNLKDGSDCLFQCFDGTILFCNDLFPIPLVYIAGCLLYTSGENGYPSILSQYLESIVRDATKDYNSLKVK